MSLKSFLNFSRNFLFASFGFSIINLIAADPVKASVCPGKGDTASLNAQNTTCTTTPKVMEIKFYELGFCTSDPLAETNFDNSTCERSWISNSGETADLASFSYIGLPSGQTYKVPNRQYDYAYVVFDPNWHLKGEVYFNSKTYYTDVYGMVQETSGEADAASNYDKFKLKLEDIGNVGSGCGVYARNTTYGNVKARLTNTNLQTLNSSSFECTTATRMVGSVALNTPLVMTDDVKAYQLTWVIRDFGLEATHAFGDDEPSQWKGGPFIPNFTLLK